MARKILIVAVLVPESSSKHTNEIEQEILNEINNDHLGIPWCYKIEKVKIIQEC